MEIINPNTLPGDNSRITCSTDAMMPPHIGPGGSGCGSNGPLPCGLLLAPDPCLENAG